MADKEATAGEKNSIRVLLVGSGGREHALAWKLSQSPLVEEILAVPGNGGTATTQKTRNVSTTSAEDFAALLKLAIDERISLLIPGPEAPLVDGIADYFHEHGPARIACFGPSRAAARMEGSKAFSKDFMHRHGIPTAAYKNFASFDTAKAYLDANRDFRFVIKADGLAAGKGVLLPTSYEETIDELHKTMVDKQFGSAGNDVVIEEYLEGEEISILSFSDGHSILSLPAAQDHKRANDGDTGKNTGGMGCYGPASIATPEMMAQIHREVLQPTIDNMRKEDTPFVGCLFTGFMLTRDGPKVLEYNVRFGDPETQTLLPLLENDLADILRRCALGTLDNIKLKIKDHFSTTVVVAAAGYPDKYPKGLEMALKPVESDTVLFHAGTSVDPPTSNFKTTGGRVIASTAIGSSVRDAVDKAYSGVASIHFQNMHYRRDIAHRELNRQHSASKQQKGLDYASAGVSIDAGNTLVKRIKASVAATARPGAHAQIGGFGGEFSLAAAGYPSESPLLVAAIDGIGTKLMIARDTRVFGTVGIDLVAMNVNDLIVQGAEPLMFLDYYACSKLNVDETAEFVEGVAEGCKLAGCALVGGETAEMPGLYQQGDFDAAGCAIGALAAGKRLLPRTDSMVEGDVLLGLASSGVHSNGFSLVRKIVQSAGLDFTSPAPWSDANGQTVGQALLNPTKIYVLPLLQALKSEHGQAIKGMAHITGGGLVENVPRMLPDGLAARIEAGSWNVPGVFGWMQRQGGVAPHEMVKTFNCGLGMVLVVSAEAADHVAGVLSSHGETVSRIGRLAKSSQGKAECVVEGLEKL